MSYLIESNITQINITKFRSGFFLGLLFGFSSDACLFYPGRLWPLLADLPLAAAAASVSSRSFVSRFSSMSISSTWWTDVGRGHMLLASMNDDTNLNERNE